MSEISKLHQREPCYIQRWVNLKGYPSKIRNSFDTFDIGDLDL